MSTRYVRDSGLTARMTLTMGLLAVLYFALMFGIWYILGGSGSGIVLAVLLSGGLFWGQWYFSDSIALRSMGAQEVTPEQAPELHAIIDGLVATADMAKPRVAIARNDVPNAFATGRSPKRAVVCVTTGLLTRLTREEVEAVLAHELSHVAHRDVTVMTVAGVTGLVAGLLVRYGGYANAGRNNNNNALVGLGLVAAGAVVWALSFVLIRALSRYRELAADRGAAYLTYKPSTLAAALVKISGEMEKIPSEDLRAQSSTNQLAFLPALNGKDVMALFSTHPPLQKRLDQLSKISAEISRRG